MEMRVEEILRRTGVVRVRGSETAAHLLSYSMRQWCCASVLDQRWYSLENGNERDPTTSHNSDRNHPRSINERLSNKHSPEEMLSLSLQPLDECPRARPVHDRLCFRLHRHRRDRVARGRISYRMQRDAREKHSPAPEAIPIVGEESFDLVITQIVRFVDLLVELRCVTMKRRC